MVKETKDTSGYILKLSRKHSKDVVVKALQYEIGVLKSTIAELEYEVDSLKSRGDKLAKQLAKEQCKMSGGKKAMYWRDMYIAEKLKNKE